MSGLTVRNLTFRYPSAGANLFSGLDFEVAPGECLGLEGDNGSGKSTLIAVLAGLIPLFKPGDLAGQVLWEGREAMGSSAVLQDLDSQLLADTVRDELAFFLRYSKRAVPGTPLRSEGSRGRSRFPVCDGNPGSDAVTPEEAAEALGLRDLLYRKVYQLSSGEKQRLILSCALAFGNPRLILLDEPTAFLDSDGRDRLAGVLLERKRSGSVILIAGHEFRGLERLLDRRLRLGGSPAAHEPSVEEPATGPGTGAPLISVSRLAVANELGELLFSGFDIEIARGEIVGLSGPNGSGKSTFARMLAGLGESVQGRICVCGEPADRATLRRTVAWVPQNPYHQFLCRTVGENLRSSRRQASGIPCIGPEEAVSRLGLSPLLDRDAQTLSYGEAQKCAILCAALSGADLMVVDEPLFNFDEASAEGLRWLLDRMTRQGKSCLLISHRREFLGRHCSRIYPLPASETADEPRTVG